MFKYAVVIGAMLSISGCQATADPKQWKRIGPGPTLEYADAQCNILADGSERQILAIGDANFVGGAALGNAIGNAIRRAEYKRNCMTLQGWKQIPKKSPT